jgi:hypothetical protein
MCFRLAINFMTLAIPAGFIIIIMYLFFMKTWPQVFTLTV